MCAVSGADRPHRETLAVTAGRPHAPGSSLNVPPTFASTYRDGGDVGYGRIGNPTWSAFEDALGALEGGSALALSSGMAAISAVLGEVDAGSKVVFPAGAYVGTRGLLRVLEERRRLRLVAVDVADAEGVIDAASDAALVWLESPTNPLLEVADLPAVLARIVPTGVITVVDNTFATPVNQRPLEWGATVVVHSATKYIGGHSDLLLGAVVTRDEQLRTRLADRRTIDGAVPGVMEAFLALRGIRTLPVRMARAQSSALVLAERLRAHPSILRARYPGLRSDPGHERAAALMDGFGAMVSFEVASAREADAVVDGLELVVPTTSLGGVETTIERRARVPGEEGLPAGLLRMSVGLEHPDDLWADLAQSLEHAARHR